MKLPNMPRKGEMVAESVRDIIRYLKSITVTGVSGGRVRQTPNGTTIHLDPPPLRRKMIKFVDFQVYGIGETDGTWKAKVWPGHVLNIDPKYGVTDTMKYWLAPELDTEPGEETEFTVSDEINLYVKVNTTNKDIITAVSVVAIEESAAINEHYQPPPSAADNAESPPPPLAGVYYYKLAEFRFESTGEPPLPVLVLDKQYHIGGPIIHRPTLPELYNIPETGGTGYKVAKHWNAAEARHELRQIVQLTETAGIEVLKPFGDGEPPYSQIPVRRIRERATGDDETDETTQIRVVASDSGNAVVVKGNSAVGGITLNGGSAVVAWDDGLVTTAGNVNIETSGGGHPWKVTCTEDDAAVSGGFFFYVLSKNSTGAYDEHGYDYVEVPIEFAGSTLTALTGTQYIYAKSQLTPYSTSGYAYQTLVDLESVETRIYLPTGSITVYASANPPIDEGANNAAGTGYWIKPIAKITVTGGVAAVDKQYLTHNPSMHLNFVIGSI
jgi:hypothetical protein